MTKINPKEKKGKKALKGLIMATKPKKEKKKNKIIKELEDSGVFG